MKIIYIFGAGASASIDEARVPVMNNFFEKAIDMLDEGIKMAWIAFAVAEEARAFPPNLDIENCGARMGVLGRLMEEIKRSKTIDNSMKDATSIILEDKLAQAISDYKARFKKDFNRKSANIEEVLSNVELYIEKSSTSADAYARLQYLMAGLFNWLDKELLDNFSRAAHHDLSDYVASSDRFEHTFISFNYDLWLEKALFQKGVWRPRDGHGSYTFEYYSPPIDRVLPENGTVILGKPHDMKQFGPFYRKSRVKVLKPHGSLSWRYGTKKTENVVLILEDGENSCVTYNNTWDMPPSKFQEKIEMSMVPLIVPPTPNKIRSHLLFWETDRDVFNTLSQADVVVVVGWSMPETDRYIREMVLRAINNRTEQIKKVFICDKSRMIKTLSPKFEAVFRPREIKAYDQGFNKGFIDFLKDEF